MARNTKKTHAHIIIFASAETEHVKFLILLKNRIFIKLHKTGFGHFPENTIERLGFDRFFGARSRGKGDPINGCSPFCGEKATKRGAPGTPNHGQGGSGERFRSALRRKVRHAPFWCFVRVGGPKCRLAHAI